MLGERQIRHLGFAVTGLLAAGVAAAGVAHAYPPATPAVVTATAQNTDANGRVYVVVSLQNFDPACSVLVKISGGGGVLLPPGSTGTTLVTRPKRNSTLQVGARTVAPCANEESSKVDVPLSTVTGEVWGRGTVVKGKDYHVHLAKFRPRSEVTLVAIGPNGQREYRTVRTDRDGKATAYWKFWVSGTWTVVVTGSQSQSVTVRVTEPPSKTKGSSRR